MLGDPGEGGSLAKEFDAALLPLSRLDPQLVACVQTTEDCAALPGGLAGIHVLRKYTKTDN